MDAAVSDTVQIVSAAAFFTKSPPAVQQSVVGANRLIVMGGQKDLNRLAGFSPVCRRFQQYGRTQLIVYIIKTLLSTLCIMSELQIIKVFIDTLF